MPFQPGQSGNPKGRPPKVVEDAQHSILVQLFDGKAEADSVKAMIRAAKQGDVAAFRELMDRKYGKVKDKVEQSGEVVIRYEYVDPDADHPET